MADSLTELPYPENVRYTDEEVEGHQQFMTSGGIEAAKDWKYLTLYATILFFLLSLPMVDDVINKIPYCENNSVMCLAAKTLIFAIGFVVIYMFVL